MKKALLLSLAFAFTGSIFTAETEVPNKLILDFKVASTESNEFWSNIAETIKDLINNSENITKESSIELVKTICIKAKETEGNGSSSININMAATADSVEIDSSDQEEHSAIVRFALIKTDDCSDELWAEVLGLVKDLSTSLENINKENVDPFEFVISKIYELIELTASSNDQLKGQTFISLIE